MPVLQWSPLNGALSAGSTGITTHFLLINLVHFEKHFAFKLKFDKVCSRIARPGEGLGSCAGEQCFVSTFMAGSDK